MRWGCALDCIGGGWVFDTGQQLALPELLWLMLTSVGAITLLALWWQFQPRTATPATLSGG